MEGLVSPLSPELQGATGLRHDAWIYEGSDEFVASAAPFVADGLAAGQDVMVATVPANLEGLRRALGADAERVSLVDMSEAGRNPGRILSLWRDFVAREGGRPKRGIGEPVWSGRTPEEIEECSRHEALINAAFDHDTDFWLICPYDASTLDDAALARLEHTHPVVHEGGAMRPGRTFDPSLPGRALEGDLPPPPSASELFAIERHRLGELRALVRAIAERAGLAPDRTDDLLVAVTELATNAVRHGGGGLAIVWSDAGALVCQVESEGRLEDPLVGRARPAPEKLDGRGLWIVHELCDLVQIRSSERGSVVRVLMRTS